MKITHTTKLNPLADAIKETQEDVEYHVELCKLAIVEVLLQFMKREGINRSELAARMQVPNSRITKMLSGDSNLTIDTLVRAGHAVGADLTQTFVPKGQTGQWVARPKSKRGADNCVPRKAYRTKRKKTKQPSPEGIQAH